jgi:hypothetical protein
MDWTAIRPAAEWRVATSSETGLESFTRVPLDRTDDPFQRSIKDEKEGSWTYVQECEWERDLWDSYRCGRGNGKLNWMDG